MARAGPEPARRARRCTVQWLTMRPSFAAGMPKREPGRGDPQVARDGELGAGAEGRAVNRRNGGKRGVMQRVEHLLQQHGERLVLDAGEIRTRAEVPVGAREDEHTRTCRVGDRRAQLIERGAGRARCDARVGRG